MADTTTTKTITVPLRTPMFDPSGNLSRTWVLFMQQIATSTTTAAPPAPSDAPFPTHNGVAY